MNTNRNLAWAVLLLAIGVYGLVRAEDLLSFRGVAAMVAAACGLATLVMTLYARRIQQRERSPERR